MEPLPDDYVRLAVVEFYAGTHLRVRVHEVTETDVKAMRAVLAADRLVVELAEMTIKGDDGRPFPDMSSKGGIQGIPLPEEPTVKQPKPKPVKKQARGGSFQF
jgi:hypothetical protein